MVALGAQSERPKKERQSSGMGLSTVACDGGCTGNIGEAVECDENIDREIRQIPQDS